ncbi:MAG: AAA family ATPase [Thermoguttaceae bacterium]|jgi:DNA sulfur modification protein DndD|nr:AAA family ATPase [Thermoguttaceae bacterium]
MIFEELTLQDFRQFSGSQTLVFATDSQKNVTVIHGFNGSGKTTVLNAFTWLLYGQCSPDFEGADHLETEATYSQLRPGDRMKMAVRAVFRERTMKYTCERSMLIEKADDGTRRVVDPGRVSVRYIDDTGEVQEPSNPQVVLERMLPPRLQPFFFFNGERIERLARADAYEQIEEGVRTLLDIEVFDRAITHLDGEPTRRLQQIVAKHAGEEGEVVQRQYEQLGVAREKLAEEMKQEERNLTSLQTELEAIDAKLATMPDLARLQAQRKAAEEREKTIKGDLKDRKVDLARTFSRSGYLILVPDVVRQAKDILEQARQKGEIPGPIKRQFVQDLLDTCKCICGRTLDPGSQEYQNVDCWRNRTSSEQLEAVTTTTKAELNSYDKRAEDCSVELDRLQAKRSELFAELRRVRELLDELSVKIGDRSEGEDPERLERRRRQINSEMDAIKLKNHDARRRLEELDGQISEKKQQLRGFERADAEGRLAQVRLTAVSNVVEALKKIRQLRYSELHEDLAKQLEEIWSRISIKDYRARLREGFRLSLTKDIGGEEVIVRGASTGEKQVLSLAFVGALGSKARQTAEKAKVGSSLFRGGLYPLVIDSAFGSLEVEYRRDVAKWIRTLSPQIILLVSETQWRREVEEELQPFIGKQWILRCETPKNRPCEIELQGTPYPYVVQSDDGYERTTFVEASR